MTRYALNLPVDLKQEAEQLAKKQGVSLNQFIMWSVSEKVASLRNQLDDPRFPLITYRRGSASDYAAPVLRGTGIRVQTVAVAVEKLNETPEEFARSYEVDIKQVKEALNFYHAHREEIEENIRYEENLEAEYKKERVKKHGKASPAS